MINKGTNDLYNLNLSNIYENKRLNKSESNQNLNINTNYINSFPKRENKSAYVGLKNLSDKNFIGHDNKQMNQNNEFYNINFNYFNRDNINNNFIENTGEQSRFRNIFQNINLSNYNNYKNKFNTNNNLNFTSYPYFCQKDNNFQNLNKLNTYDKKIYSHNISFPFNLNENYFNNIIKNKNQNQKQLINIKKENFNKNPDFSSFKSISNTSLTTLLCSKNGINQIKNLLNNNQYNIDLIRKIILSLNEENGLHKVFENIYGNYFIQELFEKMNNDLIQLTIDLISSEFVNIAKTSSGTHCLQKLLDYVNNSEMEISIIKAIRYKEKEMAFDNNATYVLQKIISIIPDKKRIRLNNFIIDNAKELSLNSNSVFVLKKFLVTNTIKENKNKIIDIIKKYFLIISQSPFGNYVIQYLFEIWPMKDCELIIKEILDKAIVLSCQRYSANIILKSFEFLNNFHKQKLLNILCFSSNILELLNNKYSYYVINRAINFMDNSTKDKFEHYLSQIVINKSYNEKLLINQIISLIKK